MWQVLASFRREAEETYLRHGMDEANVSEGRKRCQRDVAKGTGNLKNSLKLVVGRAKSTKTNIRDVIMTAKEMILVEWHNREEPQITDYMLKNGFKYDGVENDSGVVVGRRAVMTHDDFNTMCGELKLDRVSE